MATSSITNPSATGAISIGSITIDSVSSTVTVNNPIEIANDSGNPIPVTQTLKKVSTSFNRPGDTTTYSIGDSISNSTTSPTVFQLDLAPIGAKNGQSIIIDKVAITSNTKPALMLLANVYLSANTFTATNDNAALSITDTTIEAGGSWFNCNLQNYTAENTIISYSDIPQPMILAANNTTLFGTLQAANAYIPTSSEKFTIIAWVTLL